VNFKVQINIEWDAILWIQLIGEPIIRFGKYFSISAFPKRSGQNLTGYDPDHWLIPAGMALWLGCYSVFLKD